MSKGHILSAQLFYKCLAKTIFQVVFFVLTSFILATGYGAEGTPPPPPTLYHWSSLQGLNYLISIQNQEGDIVLPSLISNTTNSTNSTMPRGTMVDSLYPQLRSVRRLFTWSHPTGGLGAGTTEIYGRNEALLRLDISPNAKVLHLKGIRDLTNPQVIFYNASDGWILTDIADVNLSDYDLVYFEKKTKEKSGSETLNYREWIVINPKIVERITSNHSILAPIIQAEVNKLKNLNFSYSAEELHTPYAVDSRVPYSFYSILPREDGLSFRDHTIYRLEKYINRQDGEVPLLERNQNLCKHLIL